MLGPSTIDHIPVEEPHGPADLDAGDTVGEYVIVKKLGEGGFGTVYEAAHPVIGKRAAVKVLHAQYSADEDITSRFVAEARAVNQIRHRNIIDIFAFGDLPDGRHYYVMELLDGAPLDAYLERAGQLPPSEAIGILHAVAKALAAAHAAGIAHRDLKPENVFLEIDDDGGVAVKILDFGIAKLLAPGALASHKTRSGIPIGSPKYMSPEQCRGVHVDHRTDVYAFGCMAYRMLTGLPPFEARTALELMMTHVSLPPSAPSAACPALSAEFDEAILKTLEKEPDARPPSMLAAFDALAAAASRAGCDPAAAPTASSLLQEIITERRGIGPTALDIGKRLRSRPQPLTPRRRSLGPAVALSGAVSLAAVVLALFALRRRPLPPAGVWAASASAPAASSSAWPPLAQALPAPQAMGLTPSVPPSASPPASAPSESAMASIFVRSQPVHADVYLNDQKIGVTPGPISIPRADHPQNLVLKAPGYATATVPVHAATDDSVQVVLTPSSPPPLAPRPPRAPAVPRDLEDPY